MDHGSHRKRGKWLLCCLAVGTSSFLAGSKTSSATKEKVHSEVDPLADTQPTPVVRAEPAKAKEIIAARTPRQVEDSEFKVIVSKNVGKVGLRFRIAPEDGKVIMVLKAGAELTVIEPLDEALAKIGSKNQWLHVKNRRALQVILQPGMWNQVNFQNKKLILMNH